MPDITSITSTPYRTFRAGLKKIWRAANAPCGICHQRTIDWDGPPNESNSFELDHIISRKRAKAMGRPELVMDPTNAQPSHVRCNRGKLAGDTAHTLGERSEDW